MPQESQRKLYDFVSSRNYDLGSFETFQTKMASPDSRKKFYDFMTKENFDLGDFATFESKVRLDRLPAPYQALSDIGMAIPNYLKRQTERGVEEEAQSQAIETVAKATGKKPEDFSPEDLTAVEQQAAAKKQAGFTPLEAAKTAVQTIRHTPFVPLSEMTGLDKLDIEALPDVNLPTGIPGVSLPLKAQAAVARPVVRAVEGLTTGENLAIMGLLSKLSAPLQSLGSLGFAALMAKELPAQWQAFKDAKTPVAKTEALTSALLGLGMTGLAGIHGAKGLGKQAVKAGRAATEVAPEFAPERGGPKVEIPPLVELQKAAKTAQEIEREAKKPATATEEIQAAKQKIAEIQRQAEANLETMPAQLNALAEQIAGKPLSELSAVEQGAIKRKAIQQYKRQLAQTAEVMAFERFEGKSIKDISEAERSKIYAEAKEQIRQELVANRPKPAETPAPEPFDIEKTAKELENVTGPEVPPPFDTAIEEKIAAGNLAKEITKSARPEEKPKLTPEEMLRQENLSYTAQRLENEIGPVPSEADLGVPPARPEPAKINIRQALQENWQNNGIQVGDLLTDATPKNVFEQVSGKSWTPEVEKAFAAWRKAKGSEFELGDAEVFANEYKPVATKPATPQLAETVTVNKPIETSGGRKLTSEFSDNDLYSFEDGLLERGAKAKASAKSSNLDVTNPYEQNANTERVRGGIHDAENQLRAIWDEQLKRGLIDELPADYNDPFNIRGGKPIKSFANEESYKRLGWEKPVAETSKTTPVETRLQKAERLRNEALNLRERRQALQAERLAEQETKRQALKKKLEESGKSSKVGDLEKPVASPETFESQVQDLGDNQYKSNYKGAEVTFAVDDANKSVYLALIDVPETLRNKGLGTEAVKAFVNYAQEKYPDYTISTHATNKAAERINEKVGFTKMPTGEYRLEAKTPATIDVSKLNTPEDIMRAQERRYAELEDELRQKYNVPPDAKTLPPEAQKAVENDPILKAIDERDAAIREENLKQGEGRQAEGVTDFDINKLFGEEPAKTPEPAALQSSKTPEAEEASTAQTYFIRLEDIGTKSKSRNAETFNELLRSVKNRGVLVDKFANGDLKRVEGHYYGDYQFLDPDIDARTAFMKLPDSEKAFLTEVAVKNVKKGFDETFDTTPQEEIAINKNIDAFYFAMRIARLMDDPTAFFKEFNGVEFTIKPGQKEAKTTATSKGKISESKISTKETPLKVPEAELPTVKASTQLEQGKSIKASLIERYKQEGIPAEEWPARVKAELEKEGIAPKIVQHLTEPRRGTRPTDETGTGETTSREGRAERAVEPPPELKEGVDKISEAAKARQIADADYEVARKTLEKAIIDQLAGLKRIGINVYFDSAHGVYKLEQLTSNPQYGEAAVKMLNDAKQLLAERGGYTIEDIGEGVNVAATPGLQYEGKPVTGDLTAITNEAIRRLNVKKAADKAYDATKKQYKDDLTDYYFSQEKPPALAGKTAAGETVEVQVRQNASASEPAVLPDWYERIKKEAEALPKSKGNDYLKLFRVARETAEKAVAKKEGRLLTKIRENLDEADNASLDSAIERMNDASRESMESANTLPLSAFAKIWQSQVEIGYYVAKGLGKAALNRVAWGARMVAELGKDIEPFLDRIWDKIQSGFKPGDPLDLPETLKGSTPLATSGKPIVGDTKFPVSRGQRAYQQFQNAPGVKIAYDYYKQVVDRLEPAAPKVAAAYRQAIDIWEINENKGNVVVNALEKQVFKSPGADSRSASTVKTDLGNGYAAGYHNLYRWLTDPASRPDDLTPFEKSEILAYEKLRRKGEADMNQNLKAGEEAVKLPNFKRVPTIEFLNAIKNQGGPVYDATVEVLQRLNPGLKPEKISNYLNRFQFEKIPNFPSEITFSDRTGQTTVEILVGRGIDALRALNRDTSRLSGLYNKFGRNYNEALKRIRQQVDPAFHADFDTVRESYFGRKQYEIPPEESRNITRRVWKSIAEPMIKTALLYKQAVIQSAQSSAAIPYTGVVNYFKGLGKLLSRNLTSEQLKMLGAYFESYYTTLIRPGSKIEDVGRLISQGESNLTLMKPMVKAGDLGTLAAFKMFADNIKDRGGKLTNFERNTLESLKFTQEQIDLINKKGLAGHKDAELLYSSILNRGRKQVIGTGKKGPESTRFQLGRASEFYNFQGFTITQMQGLARLGKTVVASIADAVKNPSPAATKKAFTALGAAGAFVGMSMANAELQIALTRIFSGKDPERPVDVKRFWEDFLTSGLIWPGRELAYAFSQDGAVGGLLQSALLPLNVAGEMVDAFNSQGRYQDQELNESIAQFLDRYAGKGVYGLYNVGQGVAAVSGLAAKNPTLQTAISNYWDWQREENKFSGRGPREYNATRAGLKKLRNYLSNLPIGALTDEQKTELRNRLIEIGQAKYSETKDLDKSRTQVAQALRSRRLIQGRFDQPDTKNFKKPEDLAKALRGEKYFNAIRAYDQNLEYLAQAVESGLMF